MKTQITNLRNRGAIFLGLLFVALLLVNCSKDDDTPPVFDFEEEFADLEELPDISDPDPEVTEPETGEVEESAVTTSVVADLEDGSGDVSADTQASLDAVDAFSAGLSADAKAEADALDATRVEEILNMEDLTGTLSEVEASLDDAPAAILELLPTINFGAPLGSSSLFVENSFKGSIGDLDVKGAVMEAQQTGECFDKALEAYDDAMAPIIAQRQEQLGVIDANYQRRLGEADARTATRLAGVETNYDAYYNYILDVTVSLLTLANDVEDTNAAFAQTLRNYALIFAVQGNSKLTAWYAAATQKVADKEAAEKQNALDIKVAKTAEADANFATLKAEADAILSAAYDKCHNQGGSI